MTNWKKLLRSLGFSESEATIYLISLELGAASVQDIAKKARVSRVTTYSVIESLSKQGLISSLDKGKKRLFVAESPDRLVSFVHANLKNMEATLKEVESSIQDLKLMQQGDKPVVKLFEGHEAMRAIQDDIIKSAPKAIDEFGNLDQIKRLYPPEERQKFFDQLSKTKPNVRALFRSKDTAPTERVKSSIRTTPDELDFPGDILIYGHKVAFSTFHGKQISVLIESEEIARTVRAMFEYIWKLQAT